MSNKESRRGLASLVNATSISDIDTRPMPIQFKTKYERDGRKFVRLIERGLATCHASQSNIAAVQLAIGRQGGARPFLAMMSNMPLRARAADLLSDQLRPLWLSLPDHDWYFASFITDIGNSLINQPDVELARLKRDTNKMLALVGVDGLGVVELQVADYTGRGGGHTLSAHTHIIVCTDDPDFGPLKAAKTIAGSDILSNWLGARTADFQPIRNLPALMFRCAYMFKPPIQGSVLIEDAGKRCGYRTRHRQIGHLEALRLAEIQSHLSLRTTTFARGRLVKPKGDFIRSVTAWQRELLISNEPDYARAFQHVWRASTVRNARLAPSIRTDCSMPVDDAWATATAELRAEVAANCARFDKLRASHDVGDRTTFRRHARTVPNDS